jgi:hypothetical protein
MSGLLSAVALAAAMLLQALALTVGEGSHAAIILMAEGLALGAIVLSWPPTRELLTQGCRCGLRRAAAPLVIAVAVALEAGRRPSPARAAPVSAIAADTRSSE